jgi:hypothetical protein
VRVVLGGRSICVGVGWRHLHLQAVDDEEAAGLIAGGLVAFSADHLPQLAGNLGVLFQAKHLHDVIANHLHDVIAKHLHDVHQ